ncbi:RHS repeat-associated core domain-containing protein [Kitasatospora nipponensis]|uniref:RHS repeat-associated core domain-containing protein n=1 Tax=Kitasatospora nipponensis TaxID=258049 RepID=A0ABN1W7Z2_9ACTN
MVRRLRLRVAVVCVLAVLTTLVSPVTFALAAGKPDYSRKWSPPNTALPRTAGVHGAGAKPLPAPKPAFPVAPEWHPNQAKNPAPQSSAQLTLAPAPSADSTGARPNAAAENGAQPAAGVEATAAGLPVSVAPLAAPAGDPAAAAAAEPLKVAVTPAKTAGVAGPVISLTRQQAGQARPVQVSLDPAAAGYGGDWAARATLVELPACALTTPQAPGCGQQTPVPSHYDATAGRLVADVTLPQQDATAAPTPTTRTGAVQSALTQAATSAAQPMVLAAVSGSTSGLGSYSATSLNPSQGWSSGGSAGSFSYSYPISTPPSLGGSAPGVALSYDSSSVDGKTSSTNAQASWIGDGWDYNPGFVERTYKSCQDDGIQGSGDLCWGGANLTMSLAGHSGELVPDDGSCQSGAPGSQEQSNCSWHLKDDDATRIQFLTGATNGTFNGSYLKVTTTDGTVYYFGLNHLPGTDGNPTTTGPASGSAWTEPVFSPNPGDPCYDAAKTKASWCQTAWRWNLDYVVDPHDNLVSYSYTPEANTYSLGRGQSGNGTGTAVSYTRAGVLSTISYGQLLTDQLSNNGSYLPAAQVVFNSGERCTVSPSGCDPSQWTVSPGNWPDVPLDQYCPATGTCNNAGPSFFTTKWLNSITTQVKVGGQLQPVDSYVLNHTFVQSNNSTENTAVPWLASVQRTGQDAGAGGNAITLPPVGFVSELLGNRVYDASITPARPTYNRPRIQGITTETGGNIQVDYGTPRCAASDTQNLQPDQDTLSCYNVKWHPAGQSQGAQPVNDWFLRYPVKSVTVNPGTPGSLSQQTSYSYGNAAWHRNDSPSTKDMDRTWDQFRGYATVTAVSGAGTDDGPQSQNSTSYYQGMNGDILSNGSARSASVAGPTSGAVTDADWLSGKPLEVDTYPQATTDPNAQPNSATVTTTAGAVTTATHNRGSLPALVARYGATTGVAATKERTTTGWRTSSTTVTTDPAHGNRMLTELDSADGTPDICTRTSYATGPNPVVVGLPSETVKVSGANACTATPTAANTTGWTRIVYDGLPLGQLGAKQEAGSSLQLDHFDGSGTPQFTVTRNTGYDVYGRTVSVTDPNATDSAHPNGAVITTSYGTAGPGELPNKTVTTTPAPAGASDAATGRSTTTVLDVQRSLPLTTTDPNGRVISQSYDQLGRLVAVWAPGRTTGQPANETYSYSIPGVVNGTVVPPSETTSTLLADGQNHRVSVQILDGLARTVQQQDTPATSAYQAGRLITDTRYDSQGRAFISNATWYNGDSAPTGTYYNSPTNQIPNQTITTYDGQGRAVQSQTIAYGVVQVSSTTSYPGADRTDVNPPAGTTATTTVTDARGRTTQLWQYRTATATGNATDADVTSYAYTADGKPATRTDAAGNAWSYGYDLKGHQVTALDPDTGSSSQSYDQDGRLATSTDARSQSVSYSYDLLGRQTGSFSGTATTDPSKQLTAHTYDTVLPGQPASSTRYVGGTSGSAYTTAVATYDVGYRPTKTTITIPGSEIGKSTPFTYTYQAIYDPITGALSKDNRSAVGDIASETLGYNHDLFGLLDQIAGYNGAVYDVSSDYDAYGRSIRSTVNPWGTQIISTTTYDESTGRTLQRFVDKQTATTGSVQQTTYTYNQSGKITAVRDIPNNVPANTDLQCFGYDYLGRLTTAWSDTGKLTQLTNGTNLVGGLGNCANSTPTSGASAPSLTTVGGPAAYWQSYGYDLTGNRKSLIKHDTGGNTANDVTVNQTFGTARNTPTSAPNTGGGTGGPHGLLTATTTAPGSTGVATSQYDAAGNTTAVTDTSGTTSLNWNVENRLDSITPSGAGTTSYVYDADGNQLVRHDPGKTTITLGSDELVYDTTAQTTSGVRSYAIPNGITLVRQGGTSTYQFADPHGTNTLSIDATSLVESRRPVDPFGAPRGSQPSTWSGDKGFVGGTQDLSTGLTNLGAREYQPTSGRFLNVDSLLDSADPQQWNGYAYASNSPVNQSDPSGLMSNSRPDVGGQVSRAELDASLPDPTTTEGFTEIYPGVVVPNNTKNLSSLRQHFYADVERDNGGRIDGYDDSVTGVPPTQSKESWEVMNQGILASTLQSAIGEADSNEGSSALQSIIGGLAVMDFKHGGGKGGKGLAATKIGKAIENSAVGRIWKAIKGAAEDACETNSFPAETEIALADGKTEQIGSAKVGDGVQATDPVSGTTRPEKITAVIKTLTDTDFTDLVIHTDHGDQSLTSTQHHPYWDDTTKQWTNAADLHAGDHLTTLNGQSASVANVRNYTSRIVTYNLTVDSLHTYYVLAGTTPVLVHNTGPGCGLLEGERDYDVYHPETGNRITDIDHVGGGVLWEEKSALYGDDGWISKQIDGKLKKYIEARQYMPGYENAPIGFRLTNPSIDPRFRSALESHIDNLRQANPGVDIRLEFAQ